MPNPNFDAIASTTLKHYQKKFADNVSNHIPFYKYMKMKGAVMLSGGETIVEELMYGENAAVQSYSEADTIDTSKQTGLSAAEFQWKQVMGPITLTGTDELRNAGPEKQISLLEARTMQTQITMQNKISKMLFGDGTGNSGKDLLGLAAIVSITPTAGILGGIDRSDVRNSYWRNQAIINAGSFAASGLNQLSTMIRACTRGTDRPSLIVVGSDVYGYLQNEARGRAEFSNSKLADLGFAALKVEGIDVIFDNGCPAGRAYVLNTTYLKLHIHKDRNYAVTKFVEPANADVLVAKVKFAGQLTVSNCALQGVIDGFVA